MKKPKLIMLNGMPGLGKTTLMQRYIDDHPMELGLDIDKIWWMMGRWQESRPRSYTQKLKLSGVIAEQHLRDGYDVVIAQHFDTLEQYEAFAHIAQQINADFIEIALRVPFPEALRRFKIRGKSMGHKTGFRPGGILDNGGREKMLEQMYDAVDTIVASRPSTTVLEPIYGNIEMTYQQLLTLTMSS